MTRRPRPLVQTHAQTLLPAPRGEIKHHSNRRGAHLATSMLAESSSAALRCACSLAHCTCAHPPRASATVHIFRQPPLALGLLPRVKSTRHARGPRASPAHLALEPRNLLGGPAELLAQPHHLGLGRQVPLRRAGQLGAGGRQLGAARLEVGRRLRHLGGAGAALSPRHAQLGLGVGQVIRRLVPAQPSPASALPLLHPELCILSCAAPCRMWAARPG